MNLTEARLAPKPIPNQEFSVNCSLVLVSLTLAVSLFTTATLAHDPKEHARERAAAHARADCAALKNVDRSKVAPDDPVALALHKKCAAAEAAESGHRRQVKQGDH